jgi:hypothetical protein
MNPRLRNASFSSSSSTPGGPRRFEDEDEDEGRVAQSA